MRDSSRRDFLADVGRGMLIASVGPALAFDLGLASARADARRQSVAGPPRRRYRGRRASIVGFSPVRASSRGSSVEST